MITSNVVRVVIFSVFLTTGTMLVMQVSKVNTSVFPQGAPSRFPTSTSVALHGLRKRLLNSTGICRWPLGGTWNKNRNLEKWDHGDGNENNLTQESKNHGTLAASVHFSTFLLRSLQKTSRKCQCRGFKRRQHDDLFSDSLQVQRHFDSSLLADYLKLDVNTNQAKISSTAYDFIFENGLLLMIAALVAA